MSERAHYFDLGIVHNFTPEYQVGLDGYYKVSQNTLDDGQFGAAPILSAFNYRRGQICGVELSQSYTKADSPLTGILPLNRGSEPRLIRPNPFCLAQTITTTLPRITSISITAKVSPDRLGFPTTSSRLKRRPIWKWSAAAACAPTLTACPTAVLFQPMIQ